MLNEIIVNRLSEVGLTINDIKENINVKSTDIYTIYLYCSHLENLGTKDSDFDIYVVFKDVNKSNDLKKIGLSLNNIELDVEFYNENTIKQLIDKLYTNQLIETNDLKLLQRLKASEIIHNDVYGEKLKNCINIKHLSDKVIKLFSVEVYSNIEDCMNLYNAKDYESAIILARYLIQFSIAVLNAKNGYINLKQKWATRIFINNKGYNEDFFERYNNYCLYSNIDKESISKYTKEIINLAQDMMSDSLFD